MTDTPPGPFTGRSSTREFLLNKTESERRGDRFRDIPQPLAEDLLSRFPKPLWGSPFLDYALQALQEATRFGVLAIQMDPQQLSDGDEPSESSETPVRVSVSLLEIIEALARKDKGIWGLVAEDLVALFLPEMGTEACRNAAASIQSGMSKQAMGTTTIGIATYPTLVYDRGQILDNAFKAVDHATFFGFGSQVVFDSVSLNISGDNRYQDGDLDGAISEYLTALEMDPTNVNVHNSLGVCHGVLGNYDDAIRSFEVASELDPSEAMAVYNSGLVRMLEGQREEALKYFQKARKIGPDIFEAAFQLGKCYLDERQHHRAKAYLEEAAELKPDSLPAWRYLGDCYAALEIRDAAIQAYKKAIKRNPNDAAALSGLGHLYGLQDKNTEIATMFCKQSVELSPDNGLYHYRLGLLYAKQHCLTEAMEAFLMATQNGHDATADIERIQEGQDTEA